MQNELIPFIKTSLESKIHYNLKAGSTIAITPIDQNGKDLPKEILFKTLSDVCIYLEGEVVVDKLGETTK